LIVALVIAGLCATWFVASAFDDAALAASLGMNRHAITFVAIVIVIMALSTAAVFARFAAVRDELLAGRRVLGRWTVDPDTWNGVAPAALEADASDKRAALLTILFFVVLAFGGFALFDPTAAPGMILVGCGVAIAVAVAALVGGRIQRTHWRYRGGEVIVGERGLLSNGVLHVWALPLSRLLGARFAARRKALVVGYGWFSRTGFQEVDVILPVPASAREIATTVEAALTASGGRPKRRTAKGADVESYGAADADTGSAHATFARPVSTARPDDRKQDPTSRGEPS
jgi:hypothetical protein